jgi:hypothetical protein
MSTRVASASCQRRTNSHPDCDRDSEIVSVKQFFLFSD